MKKFLSLLMSVLLVFSAASVFPMAQAAQGREYYIDSTNGDDASDGGMYDPWRTTANLEGLSLEAGDKILFKRGGSYPCDLTLNCEGTPENPIVISSYGDGELPVLTTENPTEVLRLFDCRYVTVSDLEITAPNGGGIWIDTLEKESVGITVSGIVFHDLPNGTVTSRDDFTHGAASARACIMVKGLPARSNYPVNDLTVTGCEIYDCGNGVILWGSWKEGKNPWVDNEDEIEFIFNTGTLVEDCYFHDMDAEAVVVGICDGALVTNCRSINCCQGEGVDENGKVLYYTAAMWFWGSKNSTIQYCEIAGQKNVGDGMSVDFDSYSNNCTYQYIYSHDNMRFMVNNAKQLSQYGNTVRYCLSVNDNKGRSVIASGAGEENFSFYNNTIINCGEFRMDNLTDSLVANNIIVPTLGQKIYIEDFTKEMLTSNVFAGNCYYNCFTPIIDPFAKNTLPGFVGGEGAEAYMLVKGSPLIGAGYEIPDDDCTQDFFGNPITGNNIGCYGGKGENGSYQEEDLLAGIVRIVRQIVCRIQVEVWKLLED